MFARLSLSRPTVAAINGHAFAQEEC